MSAMNKIATKHNGHEITYDEADNTWQCKAMKCDAPSLASLRTKLNAEDRNSRRISGVRAFSLDRGWKGKEAEVVITMIESGYNGVNGYRVGQSIKKRDYFSLSSLVIINEKTAGKIERYKKATSAVEAADKELEAARDALPKATVDELRKLSAGRST